MAEISTCLFGKFDDKDGYESVLSYRGLLYLLLRLATDDDSFRAAFKSDAVGTMAAAGHEINVDALGDNDIILPSKADVEQLLRRLLADFDGDRRLGRGNRHRAPINIDDFQDDPTQS